MKIVTCLRLAIVALALSPGPGAAHDLWLSLEGKGKERHVLVNYGHPDDRPPVVIDKIVQLVVIGDAGTRSLREGLAFADRDTAIVARSKPLDNEAAVLAAARYDNGFWVRTGESSLNATRRSLPGAKEAVWSGKFAKTVTGPGAPWSHVLGDDLEIVPLSDPARVKAGGTLRVRVLWRGAPLADAEVERGDAKTAVPEDSIPRFKTGPDGEADIPIVKSGPTLLVVDRRVVPSQTPDQADADLYNATFWFEMTER